MPTDTGGSEEEAFFLRRLVERNLNGVQLVISETHQGYRTAMATALIGTAWQRYRVHCMRSVLAHVSKRDKSIVAAAIRTVSAQPSQEAARQQLAGMVSAIKSRWAKATEVLVAAEDNVLPYMTFPPEHWSRI